MSSNGSAHPIAPRSPATSSQGVGSPSAVGCKRGGVTRQTTSAPRVGRALLAEIAVSCLPASLRHLHYATASLAAFTGRPLITLRAGLALNTVDSLVKGLMPLRSLVAGFLMTTKRMRPGTTKTPSSSARRD